MNLKQAPHTDKIAVDSGWKTVEKSTCYFKNTRKLFFKPETTQNEVEEFAAFEKSLMYGQVQIANIYRVGDRLGTTESSHFCVILTHGVDSGD